MHAPCHLCALPPQHSPSEAAHPPRRARPGLAVPVGLLARPLLHLAALLLHNDRTKTRQEEGRRGELYLAGRPQGLSRQRPGEPGRFACQKGSARAAGTDAASPLLGPTRRPPIHPGAPATLRSTAAWNSSFCSASASVRASRRSARASCAAPAAAAAGGASPLGVAPAAEPLPLPPSPLLPSPLSGLEGGPCRETSQGVEGPEGCCCCCCCCCCAGCAAAAAAARSSAAALRAARATATTSTISLSKPGRKQHRHRASA